MDDADKQLPQPVQTVPGAESGADASSPRRIERHLLEHLVCPITKTTLIYDRERQELISPVAEMAFPLRDGVPLLVRDCGRELTDQDRWRHKLK